MRRASFIATAGALILMALLSSGLADPGGALRLALSLSTLTHAQAQAQAQALLHAVRPGEPGSRPLLPMQGSQTTLNKPAGTQPSAPAPAPIPAIPTPEDPPSRPTPKGQRPVAPHPAPPTPRLEPTSKPGGLPAPLTPSPSEQLLEDAERLINRREPMAPDAGRSPDAGHRRLHATPPTQRRTRRPGWEGGGHLMPEKVGSPKLSKPPK